MTKSKETEPSVSLQTGTLMRFPLFLCEGGQFLPPHKSPLSVLTFCAWFQLELQAETGKYSEILSETGISDLIVKVTKQ